MADEDFIAEHDREAIAKIVRDSPCDPTDERLHLMLVVAYALGRKTGYDEAVATAQKYMTTADTEMGGNRG